MYEPGLELLIFHHLPAFHLAGCLAHFAKRGKGVWGLGAGSRRERRAHRLEPTRRSLHSPNPVPQDLGIRRMGEAGRLHGAGKSVIIAITSLNYYCCYYNN